MEILFMFSKYVFVKESNGAEVLLILEALRIFSHSFWGKLIVEVCLTPFLGSLLLMRMIFLVYFELSLSMAVNGSLFTWTLEGAIYGRHVSISQAIWWVSEFGSINNGRGSDETQWWMGSSRIHHICLAIGFINGSSSRSLHTRGNNYSKQPQ